MTEQKLQALILDYLSKYCYVIKVVSATKAGVPDIIACNHGKFYAFEVKLPNSLNTVTALQRHNLNKIAYHKGNSYVVSSLKEVKDIIND